MYISADVQTLQFKRMLVLLGWENQECGDPFGFSILCKVSWNAFLHDKQGGAKMEEELGLEFITKHDEIL